MLCFLPNVGVGYTMKQFILEGYRGYDLWLTVWDDVKSPKAVVQILHGMAEHIARYADFAAYLNSLGYIVIGDDHRAHGRTAGESRLGMVPDGDCFADTIQDEIIITEYAKHEYGLPLIVFGHSYGSFLAQGYIQRASGDVIGAVLCGSACQTGAPVLLGKIVASVQTALQGKDAPAELIRKLSFGAYDAKFKSERKPFAWGNRDDAEREKYLADKYCDFTLSAGFYKSFFGGLSRLYKANALSSIRKDLPLFIISGDKDPVGGMGKLVVKLYNKYVSIGMTRVSMKLYPDARHELLNELNKQDVYSDIADFLDSCCESAAD